MSDMTEAQGTKLEMSTGTGSAVTITDITLANPTILTAAAHGLSNGDVVTAASFAGDDAASINGNTYVVMYKTDDTFAIALDSTDLTITDNTDSATMTPESYTEIGNILDWDNPSDTKNMIDFTTLESTRQEERPGMPRNVDLTFNLNWTSDDAGLLAAETARANDTLKTFKITYSDNSAHTFTGYVTGITNSGAVDDKVASSITIHRTGDLTLA
ncbi:MAG: hypothetical protein M0P44_07360 [Clostridiales bacterium]|nr:hypothetical protein [Clostridiales bacterium]